MIKKFSLITVTLAFSVGVNIPVVALPTPSQAVPSSVESDALKAKEDQGQEPAAMIESAQVAKSYVDGLDKEEYSESWTKGDELFQQTISQGEWISALNLTRKPLGSVHSRALRNQRPAWNPQGLPKGAYMLVEYDTSFENAPLPREVLTLHKGSEGTWRVLTYQLMDPL